MKFSLRFALSILFSLLAATCARAGWFGDKYSMFIHYGLYSIPGGVYDGQPVQRGYSEQILPFGIGFSDWYEAYTRSFTAEHFDAEGIVELARSSGMRSIVLTSKHHDGFCLWKTETTDYNAYTGTPAHRDLVGELAQACHASGMRFGLYFSLIDWHYPAAMPFSSHNADLITPEHHEYNKRQVRELLTQYGTVDELWFDMGSLTPVQSKELYDLVKDLQAHCMVSGRLGNDQADFCVMPDNQYPDYLMDMPWQSAASMFDETWGYRSWQERGSVEEKAVEKLTSLLDVVSSGGKYLLNIGPMGDGSVVPFESQVLRRIGALIAPMERAIYDTRPAPFPMIQGLVRMTMSTDGRELYLFVPRGQHEVVVPPTVQRHRSARLLGGRRVKARKQEDGSTLISGIVGDAPFNVVCLTYDQPLRADLSALLKRDDRQSIEPFYAQSSGDYYATYQSIVGYRYLLPAGNDEIELHFGDAEKGRSIDVNGQIIQLTPTVSFTHTSAHVTAVGSLQIADAPGLMGRIRTHEEYDWHSADEQWTDPIVRVVNTKSGLILRQVLHADRDTELPLDIAYTEGMLVYLNGTYIDAASATKDGGKLHLLLPLRAGDNQLVIKLYARFGLECRLHLTPLTSCSRHMMRVPRRLLVVEPGKYNILDIKRPHVSPLATPAHLSNLRVVMDMNRTKSL